MNEKLLENIGFSKGEVKVYLTLLKLGETTTGKIVEEAGISSGKIYEILNKLIQKGLVSFIIKEKTKHFNAASPKRILDYLDEKEKELNIKKQQIEKELPSFLLIESKKKNETRLFRGAKGIQTAIYEVLDNLSSKNEVLAMGIRSSKSKYYNLVWQKWHKERVRRKILCKSIFSDKNTEYFNFFKKLKFTQVKILKGITPSSMAVMDNIVILMTYEEEPSCLLIRNPEIAESIRTFFYNLWNIAKT